MSLKNYPDLRVFLSAFADTDPHTDAETTRAFVAGNPGERLRKIGDQIQLILNDPGLSLEEFGTESNRWFSEPEEARAWLRNILGTFETGLATDAVVVKDSNGTQLAEGDSVLVIKDLKVKGGSSDLKRGTIIKKVHLTDDPGAIECRVDGSTLVLKTCFLKKA